MSWAREETVPGDKSDRGAKLYGKHAAKNIGLSIVREGRELDLDPSWTRCGEHLSTRMIADQEPVCNLGVGLPLVQRVALRYEAGFKTKQSLGGHEALFLPSS